MGLAKKITVVVFLIKTQGLEEGKTGFCCQPLKTDTGEVIELFLFTIISFIHSLSPKKNPVYYIKESAGEKTAG
jgi:hypothetical protein